MDLYLLGLSGLWRDFGGVFALELAMLCLLMVAGLYVVYTDLRFRDIPNGAVWLLLGAGVLGQLWLWQIGEVELAQVGLVLAVGLAVGGALFLYGFWAPGDAKLFWATAVAFPPTLCVSTGLLSLSTPIWALLINAVLLNFLFLLGSVLLRGQRRRAQPGQWPAPKELLLLARDTAGLTGLVAGAGALALGQTLEFASSAVVVLVVFLAWDRLVPAEHRLALSLPGLALGAYSAMAPDSWLAVISLWALTWTIVGLHRLIRAWFGAALVQSLPVEALQEGMVPAAAICAAPSADRLDGAYVCVVNARGRQHCFCRPGVQLSSKDVLRLRDMDARGDFARFGGRLPVESPMPFAPFLVVSVVLTAVLAGSVFQPLLRLVRAVLE